MSKIGELKYGVNAIRALIKATGRTPDQFLGENFKALDMELGTTIIWAGMLWQNKSLTVDEVGDMLDAESGLYAEAFGEAAKAFIEAFNRLLVSEQPSKKEAEVKN